MFTGRIVLACSLLLLLTAVIVFFRQRDKRALLVGGPLGLLGILWFAYMSASMPLSFGSDRAALTLFAAILVGVALGISAEVVYYSHRPPRLADVLKPALASPIVLLPLYGAVRSIPTYEAADLLWWLLLGFQNGWFWKTVLEKAAPRLNVDA